MKKIIIRFTAYFIILIIFKSLFMNITGKTESFIIMAAVLTLFNTIIRPLLTFAALPANLLTFGLAGLFVNMLTIIISDSITGSVDIKGFWVKLLLSAAVILTDTVIRDSRYKRYSNMKH